MNMFNLIPTVSELELGDCGGGCLGCTGCNGCEATQTGAGGPSIDPVGD